VNDQVNATCAALAADPLLSGGYDAVGFSQGGLFMRAVAERCGQEPKMRRLVTMGSPHQASLCVFHLCIFISFLFFFLFVLFPLVGSWQRYNICCTEM
jgi:hypothetical protein